MANDRKELQFQDDPGAQRSFWIALGILVAVVLWMGSGVVLPSSGGDQTTAGAETETAPVSVATRMSRFTWTIRFR